MEPDLSMLPNPSVSIRVLLVDDHFVVREGLKTILSAYPMVQVAGEAATGAEGLRLAASLKPQVVLLDLRLSDIPGIEVCRKLKDLPSAPAVLVLTSYADDQLVLATIQAGADGYLLKDLAQIDLGEAILHVAGGGSFLDPVITRMLTTASRSGAAPSRTASQLAKLSPQELRILRLVADGRTNKEIASDLKLSDGTVRNYLTSIFTKLGVQNRTEAAAVWLQQNSSSKETAR